MQYSFIQDLDLAFKMDVIIRVFHIHDMDTLEHIYIYTRISDTIYIYIYMYI